MRTMAHYKNYIAQLNYAVRHADSMEYLFQLHRDLTMAKRQLKRIEERVLVRNES